MQKAALSAQSVPTPHARIWLLEPEFILRHYLLTSLAEGWPQTQAFDTAYDLEQAFKQNVPDVLVMETTLKYEHGLEKCAAWRLRYPTLPILVLSARQNLVDRLACLRAGADVFLPKPVECAELTAYVQGALERSARWQQHSPQARPPAGRRRRRGGLLLDPQKQTASLQGQSLRLTPTEFALLWALSEAPGEVWGRQALAQRLWPGESERNRDVDQFVKRLRQKLPEHAQLSIETLYRRGYRLQVTASR
ncbi:MAG: response regulator transcription factor [Candidatus Sericytochromatia bacterium]